jgi:hypothetical protein
MNNRNGLSRPRFWSASLIVAVSMVAVAQMEPHAMSWVQLIWPRQSFSMARIP